MVTKTIAYFQNKGKIKMLNIQTKTKRKEKIKVLEKIKALAAEKNLPIQQLEKTCGLSNGSIYHWDKIKPSFDKVARVAKVLGVPMEHFMEDINE